LLLVSVAVASGCFTARDTTNEPLDAEKIASLQPGETRAADVVELLGAPTEVVQLARRSAYRYDFTNSKRSGLFLIVANFINEDTRSDRLWVFFDDAQVLSHLGLTLQGDASEYAMPWEPLHGEE
jgi:outer membrane protein assembly factor BamE (lipoprotein component of BamABCDE complex)